MLERTFSLALQRALLGSVELPRELGVPLARYWTPKTRHLPTFSTSRPHVHINRPRCGNFRHRQWASNAELLLRNLPRVGYINDHPGCCPWPVQNGHIERQACSHTQPNGGPAFITGHHGHLTEGQVSSRIDDFVSVNRQIARRASGIVGRGLDQHLPAKVRLRRCLD